MLNQHFVRYESSSSLSKSSLSKTVRQRSSYLSSPCLRFRDSPSSASSLSSPLPRNSLLVILAQPSMCPRFFTSAKDRLDLSGQLLVKRHFCPLCPVSN